MTTGWLKNLNPSVRTYASNEIAKELPENYLGSSKSVRGGSNEINAHICVTKCTFDFDPEGQMIVEYWGGEVLLPGESRTLLIGQWHGEYKFVFGYANAKTLANGFVLDKIYVPYNVYDTDLNQEVEKELLLGSNINNGGAPANYHFSEIDSHFPTDVPSNKSYPIYMDVTVATTPVAGEKLAINLMFTKTL